MKGGTKNICTDSFWLKTTSQWIRKLKFKKRKHSNTFDSIRNLSFENIVQYATSKLKKEYPVMSEAESKYKLCLEAKLIRRKREVQVVGKPNGLNALGIDCAFQILSIEEGSRFFLVQKSNSGINSLKTVYFATFLFLRRVSEPQLA